MHEQLILVQILGDNTAIPMVTSAEGESEAASIVDLYPSADYHFTYAHMTLSPLEDWEIDVFGDG